jgi:uncharacterized alpha-E superfamily protein
MLSRIADSLFWLNRYMERCDCLVRMIRTNYILSFDADHRTDFSWKDVIKLFAGEHKIEDHPGTNTAASIRFLVTDTRNINSVKILVNRARENARGVQDYITKELWEQVNQQYHVVNHSNIDDRITGAQSMEVIDLLDQNNTLFYGVTDSTMPRGQGWQFMNLGKFTERCMLTIDMLYAYAQKIKEQPDVPKDILFWRNLLLSLSGYELYLKTYTRGQYSLNVMDHVIFNKNFPRSLIYSLFRIRRYLNEIADHSNMEGSLTLQKQLGRICSKVEFSDTGSVIEEGLTNFLEKLRHDLTDFSQQLTRIYFSYA